MRRGLREGEIASLPDGVDRGRRSDGAAAACSSPPEEEGGGTSNAAQATSVADFDGIDGLVTAASRRAPSPPRCRPTGRITWKMISAFSAKYGIKVNSAQPRCEQPGRDHRGQPIEGHQPCPGRLRPYLNIAGQYQPVRALQGAGMERHPRSPQGAERAMVQRLRRLHVDRLRRQQGPRPDEHEGPAEARLQGQGRPQRRLRRRPPPTGSCAALDNGASATTSPCCAVLRRPEEGRQLPAGRPRRRLRSR